MKAVLYIHGKNGSGAETEQYKEFFPGCAVIGLEYQSFTPWETGKEIHKAAAELANKYGSISLIANSIGAYFSMHAGIESLIQRAYFISPIVDMEKLMIGMMTWEHVTEKELQERKTIHTSFGEDLSWEYLSWVRKHPIHWAVPTQILYGGRDQLTSRDTISDFASQHRAGLTVMEDGEHWFHTEEQIRFLNRWMRECLSGEKDN